MSEPIYKFFRGKFLPAWYQLSKKEQESILAKLDETKAKLDVRRCFYARHIGAQMNGCGPESRRPRISKPRRSTWRPFRN
jgi:hypothetical protein